MSLSLSRVFSTAVSYPTQEMNHAFHTCGAPRPVFLCFSMINTISNNQVRRVWGEGCGAKGARLWTFIGFMMMFGSLIDSIWILSVFSGLHYSQNKETPLTVSKCLLTA
uniref:Transmembrane protein 50B n=1 Tax=Oncorhynchus kisutch TaxID=8019 RepID=A0A8C7FCB8_ONCKI